MSYTVVTDREIEKLFTWKELEVIGWQWNSLDARVKPWKEFGLVRFSTDVTYDPFLIGEKTRNTFETFFSDVIGKVEDAIAKSSALNISEDIVVEDVFHNQIWFYRHATEILTIHEHIAKDSSVPVQESLSFSERVGKSSDKQFADSFEIAFSEFAEEAIFNRLFTSSFEIAQTKQKKDSIKAVEAPIFVFDEHMKMPIIRHNNESFELTESVKRFVAFNRFISESFSAADAVKKAVSLPVEDSFSIIEDLLTGGGVTVSDLRYLDKAMSDTDFEDLFTKSSPSGYDEFIPFLTGNYEYEEALIKIAMTTKDSSRPNISQLRIEVDLPDVFDKGTVDIDSLPPGEKPGPGEAIVVRYSDDKKFYTVPDISVSMQSGITDFVPIIEVDVPTNEAEALLFFRVRLKKPGDPAWAPSGKFSWKAQGY